MNKLWSPKTIKEIISKHKFQINKGLGQNFLVDMNILNKIIKAAEISQDTGIIEIGPGIGVLTHALAQKAKNVIGIEIDSKLIPILEDVLSHHKNIKIINADILKTNVNQIIKEYLSGGQIKLVANLPYYITSPIIMQILTQVPIIDTMVFMVQKELADRMVAKAGEKDYSSLSVAIQYFTQAEIITEVSSKCFFPQPKVNSSVIRLKRHKSPIIYLEDEKKFFNIVKASFGQRRKTLLNALYNSRQFEMTKTQIKEELNKININEQQRGETLSIKDFAQISNKIK